MYKYFSIIFFQVYAENKNMSTIFKSEYLLCFKKYFIFLKKKDMEITKEQLIQIWTYYCEKEAKDPDDFSHYGYPDGIPDENYKYIIRINNIISLEVEMYTPSKQYKINIFFSDILKYKSYNIENSEFEALLLMWESGKNLALKVSKGIIIENGINALKQLLISSNKLTV